MSNAIKFCLNLIGVLSLAACGGYDDGYGGSASTAPLPTIALDVQPTLVRLGERAQLTWTASTGAVCTASGGWNGAEPAAGTQQVTPAALGSISYTLTCHTPPGGSFPYASADASQSVTLNVTVANAFTATSLTANTASALVLDARLINPWGIAFGPTTTAWVANNRTNSSTLYNGNGRAQPEASPRTVTLPLGASGATFEPTGIVANKSADFVVHNTTAAAPAKFIFAGKRGSLAAWSPTVDANNAINVYDDAAAVYTGLAIAGDGTGNFLYAADFYNGRVDVFDASFVKQTASATRFAFVDSDLPAGYAPFGIQALDAGAAGATQIYVAYAKQSAVDPHTSVSGAGLGLIDVYDLNGQLIRQLVIPGGVLNAPWGMALAPADFGAVSNRILVGNFGDGHINSFGATTGQFGATLSDSRGTPLALPGLWGIAFGNDTNNQPHNTLFYVAGANNEADGEFGRVDLGATPPLLD